MLNHGRLGGTGKLVILPVDQGFEHGPARSFAVNPPAYDPRYHFQLAIEAGCNAYAAPLGFLEAGARDFAGEIPLILKLNDHDLVYDDKDPIPSLTGSVEDALRLGCAAIGFTIYPGSAHTPEMYEQIRDLGAEAKEAGLAVVIWSYPRGSGLSKEGETGIDVCGYAAHLAAELGAHIVKVKLPTGHLEQAEAKKVYEKQRIPIGDYEERVRHVVQCCFAGRRILIFSGGPGGRHGDFPRKRAGDPRGRRLRLHRRAQLVPAAQGGGGQVPPRHHGHLRGEGQGLTPDAGRFRKDMMPKAKGQAPEAHRGCRPEFQDEGLGRPARMGRRLRSPLRPARARLAGGKPEGEEFPAPADRAENLLNERARFLSHCPAGVFLSFFTDATAISLRLVNDNAEIEGTMPASGSDGAELYLRDGPRWLPVATATPPSGQAEIDCALVSDLEQALPPGRREYRLYLPLYKRVKSVALGFSPGAKIEPSPVPPRREADFRLRHLRHAGRLRQHGGHRLCLPARAPARHRDDQLRLCRQRHGRSGDGGTHPRGGRRNVHPRLRRQRHARDARRHPAPLRPPPAREAPAGAHRPDRPRRLQSCLLQGADTRRRRSHRDITMRFYLETRAAGDPNLHYIDGWAVLPAGLPGLFVDGFHPTSAGFIAMTERLAPLLTMIRFDSRRRLM